MQLHFSSDELHLLWEILLESVPGHDDLLKMALAHDLRFDCEQMDRLADVLTQARQKLEADASLSEAGESLRPKLTLLARMQERVQEACAMI